MRTDLLPYLFSFVWPAAALLLLLCPSFRRRCQARAHRSTFLFALCAIVIVSLPVGGIPLGRWFTGLCANFSLPLLALIADLISRRVFEFHLLGGSGRRAATWFGLGAGALLYPIALGLGNVDPYEFGWSSYCFFGAVGIITAWLLLQGNRFGLVLLVAIAAFHLRLLESDNYWDYLVDPVYFLTSLVAVSLRLPRLIGRMSRKESLPE